MTQFQTFINSRFSFDNDDGLMICKYFITYTQIDVQQFRVTLIQHMESVKKSIDERAQHKRENNRRVNDRVMQSKEGKVDSSTTLDAGLVVTESNETESERHVSSSRSGKDTHAEDADINSVNDKQPLAEVQLTVQHDTLANEQQHSVQSEPIYDTHLLEKVDRNTIPDSTNMCHRGGEIEQNAEKCQVSCPLLDPSFDNMTTEFSNQSLESENIFLKKTVAQLQKDFSRMEAHCVNMELKYQNQALKDGQHGQILNETSNKAKINKEIEVLEKINIELEHSVAKLLAENEKLHKENEHLKQTYKDLYGSIKKTRVQTKDHNDSLIAQKNKRVLANPHHVIAPGSSRNSQEESYGSNDMAHNHYLEEARKKTQERNRNSKPSVMHTTSLQNTTNGSKQKSRSNNQTSRSLPVSKSSGVTNSMPLVDHSRNSSSFLDSKHFVCSTCQKCVFNANHDDCITKFLKEVNSCAKISKGYRLSPNKSSAGHEKTNTPRSYLRWKPTGRIFNIIGLRCVPTRKIFTSSTTKVNSKPPNGSNEDITNPYECEQTLNVIASTLNLSEGIPDGDSSWSKTSKEKYEHVGPKVTSLQEGKRSQDDDKRLDLVDDQSQGMSCSLIFNLELVPSCLINCDLEPLSLDHELLEIINLSSSLVDSKNLLDRVFSCTSLFSLPECLKADNTIRVNQLVTV
ncbi:hypothetical protein Tco_1210843 [Tanacetum coccineum]